MPGRLFVKTFGCQMNEYDSARMADVLRDAEGLEPTEEPHDADVLLVNTCSVREKAQEKVFSLLGEWRRIKQRRPHVIIGVGGCVASQEGEGITARARWVDLVFGPQTLHRLPRDDSRGQDARPGSRRCELPGDREIRSPSRAAGRRCHRIRIHHGRLQQVLHVLRRTLYAWRGNEPPVRTGHARGEHARSPRRARGDFARAERRRLRGRDGRWQRRGSRNTHSLCRRDRWDRAHPLHHLAPRRIRRQPDRSVRQRAEARGSSASAGAERAPIAFLRR